MTSAGSTVSSLPTLGEGWSELHFMSKSSEPASRWPDLAGRIEGETHILPIRVYYEDTDFAGHVYHANYLKFCERGRSDFIRLLGIDHQSLAAAKMGERRFCRASHRDRLSEARAGR